MFNQSREQSTDLNKDMYIHLIIPEKNIKFVMRDGTLRDNIINAGGTLEIGCKVFDVSRSEQMIPSFT